MNTFCYKKIGVTGGIGSGKSTICKIFEALDIPSYNSDDRAKVLIHTHPILIDLYEKHFGHDVFQEGEMDTKKVAKILFKSPSILKRIQEVVHPIVRNDFVQWAQNQKSSWVINEAAVLFEGGLYKEMDLIVTVVAPEKLRIERVMKRSGLTQREVKARIANQWTDNEKIALSDFVVYADDHQLVTPQIIGFYNKYINNVL